MPTLQVRDLPEDVYQKLLTAAEKENRSITQQTITLLQEALGMPESSKVRRIKILDEIKKRNKMNVPQNPAELIRADRDR